MLWIHPNKNSNLPFRKCQGIGLAWLIMTGVLLCVSTFSAVTNSYKLCCSIKVFSCPQTWTMLFCFRDQNIEFIIFSQFFMTRKFKYPFYVCFYVLKFRCCWAKISQTQNSHEVFFLSSVHPLSYDFTWQHNLTVSCVMKDIMQKTVV